MGHADTRSPALAAADLDALASRVEGPLLRPTDAGYDAERSGYQTAARHRPAVIVGATNAADVRAAVALASSHELPVAVQATGHGLSAAADGGLLISTTRMNAVRVDPAARTVWVAAGVRWGQVIEA